MVVAFQIAAGLLARGEAWSRLYNGTGCHVMHAPAVGRRFGWSCSFIGISPRTKKPLVRMGQEAGSGTSRGTTLLRHILTNVTSATARGKQARTVSAGNGAGWPSLASGIEGAVHRGSSEVISV